MPCGSSHGRLSFVCADFFRTSANYGNLFFPATKLGHPVGLSPMLTLRFLLQQVLAAVVAILHRLRRHRHGRVDGISRRVIPHPGAVGHWQQNVQPRFVILVGVRLVGVKHGTGTGEVAGLPPIEFGNGRPIPLVE